MKNQNETVKSLDDRQKGRIGIKEMLDCMPENEDKDESGSAVSKETA